MLKAPPPSSQYNPQQQMANPQEVYRAHPPISNFTRSAFTTPQLWSCHQQKGQNCFNTSLQMSSFQHKMVNASSKLKLLQIWDCFNACVALLMFCYLMFVAPAPPERETILLCSLSCHCSLLSLISSSNCQFPKAARSATKIILGWLNCKAGKENLPNCSPSVQPPPCTSQ